MFKIGKWTTSAMSYPDNVDAVFLQPVHSVLG